MRIVEEVFREDGGAEGVLQNEEVLLPVGITVGIVGADAPGGETLACSCVEGIGKSVCLCIARAGVAAPSGSLAPLRAIACCIGMDGDKKDILCANGSADLVDSVAAFTQGDILQFGDNDQCG